MEAADPVEENSLLGSIKIPRELLDLDLGAVVDDVRTEFLHDCSREYATARQASAQLSLRRLLHVNHTRIRKRIEEGDIDIESDDDESDPIPVHQYESLLTKDYGPPNPTASRKSERNAVGSAQSSKLGSGRRGLNFVKLQGGGYKCVGRYGQVQMIPRVTVKIPVIDRHLEPMFQSSKPVHSTDVFFKSYYRKFLGNRVQKPSRMSPVRKLPQPLTIMNETAVQRAIRLAKQRYRGDEWDNPELDKNPPTKRVRATPKDSAISQPVPVILSKGVLLGSRTPVQSVERPQLSNTETSARSVKQPRLLSTASPTQSVKQPKFLNTEIPARTIKQLQLLNTEMPAKSVKQPRPLNTETPTQSVRQPQFFNTEIPAQSVKQLQLLNTEMRAKSVKQPRPLNTETPTQSVMQSQFFNTEIPAQSVKQLQLLNTEMRAKSVKQPRPLNTETPTQSVMQSQFFNTEIPAQSVKQLQLLNTEMPAKSVKQPRLLNTDTPAQSVKQAQFFNTEIPAQSVKHLQLLNTESPAQSVTQPQFLNTETPAQSVEQPRLMNTETPAQSFKQPKFLNTETPAETSKPVKKHPLLNGETPEEREVRITKEKLFGPSKMGLLSGIKFKVNPDSNRARKIVLPESRSVLERTIQKSSDTTRERQKLEAAIPSKTLQKPATLSDESPSPPSSPTISSRKTSGDNMEPEPRPAATTNDTRNSATLDPTAFLSKPRCPITIPDPDDDQDVLNICIELEGTGWEL